MYYYTRTCTEITNVEPTKKKQRLTDIKCNWIRFYAIGLETRVVVNYFYYYFFILFQTLNRFLDGLCGIETESNKTKRTTSLINTRRITIK